MPDVELNTRGVDIATAVEDAAEATREALLVGAQIGLVGADKLWKTNAAEDGIEGYTVAEQIVADPSDYAQGTDTTLGVDIAGREFWRLEQSVSQGSLLTFHWPGTNTTPSATNHTLNIKVTGITAAVDWQVEEIAPGLEGAVGVITFVNNESNTNECFPQDHATTGASILYYDGVEQADLVVPTGAGSMLFVYVKIATTGATGLVFITGFDTYTA